jgi:hypothetical protein
MVIPKALNLGIQFASTENSYYSLGLVNKTNNPRIMSPNTHKTIMTVAPMPVPMAAPAFSAFDDIASILSDAELIPPTNQIAIKALKAIKPHLISFPKNVRVGFRSRTPHLGHLTALSLTSFLHSGQLINGIFDSPLLQWFYRLKTKKILRTLH